MEERFEREGEGEGGEDEREEEDGEKGEFFRGGEVEEGLEGEREEEEEEEEGEGVKGGVFREGDL